VEILRTYFDELKRDVLKTFQADRLVASRIYKREEIAQFWRKQSDWFGMQHEAVEGFDRQLRKMGITDPDLEPLKRLLRESYEAALG
jgi:hypothetical protein